MTPKDKKSLLPISDEFLAIEEILPPIDHDETREPSPDELAALINPPDEKEGQSDSEETADFDSDLGEYCSAAEAEEPPWIEKTDENVAPQIDASMDEEDNNWADEDPGSLSEPDDDWFADKDYDSEAEDDGGREGPVEKADDQFGIEPESWNELDRDSVEQGPWDSLDVGDGQKLEPPRRDSGTDLNEVFGLIIDRHFLGPREGGVRAAAFIGGSPTGVGDGLFVLGADGMLHPARGAQILAAMEATSLCSDQDALFIGTVCGGAFVTRNRGKTLNQINGWHAQGLQNLEQTSFERVSTSFDISGIRTPRGYRLIGRTGNGQLFVSFDHGRLWSGLAIPGHCLGLCAVSGSADVIALVDLKDRGVGLFRSRELKDWEEVNLPEALAEPPKISAVCMAAGGETIAVGDASMPLCYSLDSGRTWMHATQVKGATAVAIDQNDPGWMAAAVYDAVSDLGLIRISEDGGQTWHTAYSVGEVDDGDRRGNSEGLRSEHRISSLDINSGREREVIAVTTGGVHLIILARRGVSH